MHPTPDPTGPGQESVWEYPRPPALDVSGRRVRIVHRGVIVADTAAALRVLETSHPPTYYIPPGDVAAGVLRASAQGGSWCEWKGVARYWDAVVGDEVFPGVAWSYPQPSATFEGLRDHVAFYCAPFDECLVDGARAVAQPGGFYGGWVTPSVAGPFKGGPGSRFW